MLDSGDAREPNVQTFQPTNDDTTLWKNVPSRKHWLLRGGLPLNLGELAAHTQSFVGEAVNVTAVVAAPLRVVSDFDVAANGPRAEGTVDYLLVVAYRLDFLRQAQMAALTVGLSAVIADDRACLDRLAPPDAAFIPPCSLVPQRERLWAK